MYKFMGEYYKYAVIGFTSVDGSEDGFYLHENDASVGEYKKDSDWEHDIIGYTNEENEDFTGL